MNSDAQIRALQQAIERAGSQRELAKIAGVTQQAISKCLRGRMGFPVRGGATLKAEAATGVSRHDLRPDIYPRDLPPAPDSLSAPPVGRAA